MFGPLVICKDVTRLICELPEQRRRNLDPQHRSMRMFCALEVSGT